MSQRQRAFLIAALLFLGLCVPLWFLATQPKLADAKPYYPHYVYSLTFRGEAFRVNAVHACIPVARDSDRDSDGFRYEAFPAVAAYELRNGLYLISPRNRCLTEKQRMREISMQMPSRAHSEFVTDSLFPPAPQCRLLLEDLQYEKWNDAPPPELRTAAIEKALWMVRETGWGLLKTTAKVVAYRKYLSTIDDPRKIFYRRPFDSYGCGAYADRGSPIFPVEYFDRLPREFLEGVRKESLETPPGVLPPRLPN